MPSPTEFGLIVLLAALLSGCAAPPKGFPAPESLVQDCIAQHSGKPRTNAELLAWGLAQKKALDDCNLDKEALRAWNSRISSPK